MRVAVAADEASPVVEGLRAQLAEAGHEVVPTVPDGSPWPLVGRATGQAVAEGRADVGVVCCWTGTGVAMAAGKVPGVRAALCVDAETARGARRWNDANVLALSLRLASAAVAAEVLDAFLATSPDPAEAAAVADVEVAPPLPAGPGDAGPAGAGPTDVEAAPPLPGSPRPEGEGGEGRR